MVFSSGSSTSALPAQLRQDISRAGYYPELVCDVVDMALAGEQPQGHLVHLETTFDHDVLRRHVTVLAVTGTGLVIAHADDHDLPDAAATVTATTEAVPLRAVRGVMVTHVVPSPDSYRPGTMQREVTVTIGWGAVSRVDMIPATCGDPNCDADHGFEGTIAADDISLRVSAAADGEQAVARALQFAAVLSAAVGRASGSGAAERH